MGTLPHPSCLGRRHHRARCTESANAYLILGARARAWAIIEQPFAYETADVGFLQLVANQVAVAVENAIAFQEVEALKDQLAKENAYLEEEVRTEHHFGELIGKLPSYNWS